MTGAPVPGPPPGEPGLPPSEPGPPPRPRRITGAAPPHDLYADAVVARVPGYRDLTLDLLRPVGAEPVPLVVWIHGGAYLGGTHREMPPPLRAARLDEHLLDAGFAVAHASYRFSGEARFPAQILDVRAAIRWLRRHSGELGIDAARFGVWGESAGGHLAALACLAPDAPFTGDDDGASHGAEEEASVGGAAVQAGVIWYAPSDFRTMREQSGPDAVIDHDAADSPESLLLGAPVPAAPSAARAASPVTYAHAGAPPLLLAHGAADRVVPVGQSEQLHRALDEGGADSRLTIVPGADHCFLGADVEPLVAQAVAFFAEKLAEAPAGEAPMGEAPMGEDPPLIEGEDSR
ncbi:alpha/beta hydrolase [Actinomadura decatromicini]|uniref:Alpha/beta hydrolase n=1 Tax=Actinomadura decatromicini TaxID=2604572 RepID=A0A5D3FS78_9ACTN|nr:alpha/beta hydrolase [Actinomadura decatromicini]TYK51043.1 alpha/beta hydrolase [Actinomadura decatromicini]